MPKYVIERQYLVPMYQHIVVEAETPDAACEMAVTDDIAWDTQEMDSDSARKTTLTVVKEVPEGYDADQAQALIIAGRNPKGLPLDMLSLASFLYEDEAKTGPLLENPRGIHRRRITRPAPSAAVEGASGVGAVRPSRSCPEPSRNRPVVLGAASVGVRQTRRARLQAEFDPCVCSHQHGLSPS